ncbi:MAG: inner membrane CreD family protein, partial [Pseudoxanthomonas sp.]
MKSLKLLLRFLTVGGLVLLLLIPLMLIRGAISDRQQYRQQASERVSQSMAGPQQFIGPLRVVPYKEKRVTDLVTDAAKPIRKTEIVEGYLYQTPTTLHVQGSMKPDTRRIGLYDVRVFEWQAGVEATFEPLPLAAVEGRVYGEPTLVVGLADVRGLVGSPDFKVDGQAVVLESGAGSLEGRMSGMHARLPQAAGAELPASRLLANFRLNGTQSLGITPIADSNQITIGSAWPHPLFGGNFLP